MEELKGVTNLAEFGVMGAMLIITLTAFWYVFRTLIKQYQDEREHYWRNSDLRQEGIMAKMADMTEKADQRHVEIMKVLWRMNGRDSNTS